MTDDESNQQRGTLIKLNRGNVMGRSETRIKFLRARMLKNQRSNLHYNKTDRK